MPETAPRWLVPGMSAVRFRRITKRERFFEIPPSDSSACEGKSTCAFWLEIGDYAVTVGGNQMEPAEVVAAQKQADGTVVVATNVPEIIAEAQTSPSGTLDFGIFPARDVLPAPVAAVFPWMLVVLGGFAVAGLALED